SVPPRSEARVDSSYPVLACLRPAPARGPRCSLRRSRSGAGATRAGDGRAPGGFLSLFCRGFAESGGWRALRDRAAAVWPSLQRRLAELGEPIDAALGALEPAIHVVQQDRTGIRRDRAQIARAAWPGAQQRGAGERPLAIGS